jgi:hypothetical protein
MHKQQIYWFNYNFVFYVDIVLQYNWIKICFALILDFKIIYKYLLKLLLNLKLFRHHCICVAFHIMVIFNGI